MGRRKNCHKISSKRGFKKLHEKCFFCGESNYSALQVHRILKGENNGEYDFFNAIVLCSSCHSKIHGEDPVIIIDRKYTQAPKSSLVVHFWHKNKEYWIDEDVGFYSFLQDDDLGKSIGLN